MNVPEQLSDLSQSGGKVVLMTLCALFMIAAIGRQLPAYAADKSAVVSLANLDLSTEKGMQAARDRIHHGCAREWSIPGRYLIRPTMCVASMTPRLLPWHRCKDCSLSRTPTLTPADAALVSHCLGFPGSGDLRSPAANRHSLGSRRMNAKQVPVALTRKCSMWQSRYRVARDGQTFNLIVISNRAAPRV